MVDPLNFKFVNNRRPPCSRCGRPLILTRIEPEEVGFDLRTDVSNPKSHNGIIFKTGLKEHGWATIDRVMNPDTLRIQPPAVEFVKSFFSAGKPVAVICHGPWTVIEAGAARGRRIASWPSLKTDLRNAGAEWVDEEVVVDGNLVSSRKPDDIPAFNREMINVFSRARAHAG